MATYYKYTEREDDSYINWGAIGTKINTDLEKVSKEREDRKDKYDKEYDVFRDVLKTVPQGNDKSTNDASLAVASLSTTKALELENDFKSGRITERAYIAKRQKQKDGVVNMYGAFAEIQKQTADYIKRAQDNVSGAVEAENLRRIEAFSKFNDVDYDQLPNGETVMINRVTGEKITSAGALTISTTKVDAYNLTKANTDFVGTLNRQNNQDKKGAQKTGVDLKDEGNIQATKNYVDATTSTAEGVTAVLFEVKGNYNKLLKFVYQPSTNINEVYMENGVPQYTEAQIELAKKMLTASINVQATNDNTTVAAKVDKPEDTKLSNDEKIYNDNVKKYDESHAKSLRATSGAKQQVMDAEYDKVIYAIPDNKDYYEPNKNLRREKAREAAYKVFSKGDGFNG